VDEQEEAAIVAICRKRGVEAVGVRARGAVLVIEPAASAALPGPEVFRELASELSALGHRYVTVDLGGYVAEGGEQ